MIRYFQKLEKKEPKRLCNKCKKYFNKDKCSGFGNHVVCKEYSNKKQISSSGQLNVPAHVLKEAKVKKCDFFKFKVLSKGKILLIKI